MNTILQDLNELAAKNKETNEKSLPPQIALVQRYLVKAVKAKCAQLKICEHLPMGIVYWVREMGFSVDIKGSSEFYTPWSVTFSGWQCSEARCNEKSSDRYCEGCSSTWNVNSVEWYKDLEHEKKKQHRIKTNKK